MFQTVRLGRLLGVEVFLHWTLWPLLLYLLLTAMIAGGWAAIATTFSLLFILFSSVLLHELGHALAAESVAIKTKDIVLLPVGGVARFNVHEIPPRKELWIASAGPLANLAIAVMTLLAAMLFANDPIQLDVLPNPTVWGQIIQLNLILALSNLIPALPLDGGRMFRAVVAMRKGNLVGTQMAARVSRWMGIAMILVAPFTSWLLVLLGLFIILGSLKELFMARFREVLQGDKYGRSTVWSNESTSGQTFPDEPFPKLE